VNPIRVTLTDTGDLKSLESAWRALESHAHPSVFQSWSWVQCWLQTPGVSPQLLTARDGDDIAGLALLQSAPKRHFIGKPTLYLQETGVPEIDALYIEYNDILSSPDARDRVADACLKFLTEIAENGQIIRLSGVSETWRQQSESTPLACKIQQKGTSYFVDLEPIRAQGLPYIKVLSRNTRQKLTRSRRKIEEAGPITLKRADTVAEAQKFLDQLSALHQKTWRARGKPGAFQNVVFSAFHQRYIETSFNEGTIDLLRVRANDIDLGYLLNFIYGGVVYQYQSGVDYTLKNHHPGYLTHAAAIQYYLDSGLLIYDFMAGDNQQKASLSTCTEPLYWITLQRRGFATILENMARRALRR
jgi:CelD/BcsL family acetyltransferase involved in cellulose biosynthesis